MSEKMASQCPADLLFAIEVAGRPNVPNPLHGANPGKLGFSDLSVPAPDVLDRSEASQRRDLIGGVAEFGHHFVGVFAEER